MYRPTRLIVVTFALLALFTLIVSAASRKLITGWVRVAPLPQPIAYARAVVYDHTIYVVGGEVPDWTTPVASVLQAQVEADGSIKEWATPTAPFAISLPLPLNRHALVLIFICQSLRKNNLSTGLAHYEDSCLLSSSICACCHRLWAGWAALC